MPAVYPSGENVYVRDHKATQGLKIDFSRNPSEFAINKYIQIQSVDKSSGYYLELTVEEAGRVMHSDISEAVWPDSSDRPQRNEGTESFQWKTYQTERYNFGFNLGDKAIEQASWDLLETHSRIKAQQAMTARTVKAISVATDTNTYDATHQSAVASIAGNTGNWAASTTARQDLKRSLNFASNKVKLDTLSAVKTEDLQLVINPETAIEIAECQEIVDHIKHSDHSVAQVKGTLFSNNMEFGLPDTLYGYNVVVEDAVKVSTHKGATTSKSYVLPSGTAFLAARPGDLESPGQGPSFSTLQLFAYEEMTVETIRDDKHRYTLGAVVDDYSILATAPVTGFLFTSAV